MSDDEYARWYEDAVRQRVGEGWKADELLDVFQYQPSLRVICADQAPPSRLMPLRERRRLKDFIDHCIRQRGPKRARWKAEEVDGWSRLDFIAAVRQLQDEGESGSKVGLTRRVDGIGATALWNRWAKVRQAGEKWPSGKNGPTGR